MRPLGPKTLIALGSNEESAWGDSRETVQKAMLAVAEISDQPPKMSGFFATPAFPVGAGPDFVNAAMVISIRLVPADLLARLHEIEATVGRTRARRWGQRTLDLDLIAVGDTVLPSHAAHQRWRDLPLTQQQEQIPDELILPHPRLQDRAFVLVPMLDVAPGWQHPVLGCSIAQMVAALPEEQQAEVTRLSDPHTP
jgi:2-amino-4-hydroxy-6-hydroxymethyldihydropteridine diphosphokinase